MNSLTKSLIVCGVISTSMYAAATKTCIDSRLKKDAVQFIDSKGKKHSYVLLKVLNTKELLAKGNKAGILPNNDIIVKTSDSTVVSIGKVTEKCVIKPKVYASL